MSLLTAVSTVAEAAHEELAPLWMPAPMFAVVMGALLALLGFVTFSYRDVSNRHRAKTERNGSDAHDRH